MSTRTCWCGARELAPYGPDYFECASCGTLVRSVMPQEDITRVRDEERDLYGRSYWFEHQKQLGLPTLDARRVTDLGDRQIHWLRTVLAVKTPPARVLELGSAHGGFVALLRTAGFDAIGLELSPWLVEQANQAGAPTLLGPIEDQPLEPRSFDLVVAFDVLEHLPDPVGTLSRCATLLRDDGALMLQTPRHDPRLDYERARNSRFGSMLIAEHLHLFSEESLERLLHRIGLTAVAAQPPVFDTDMIVVAGRRALVRAEIPAEQPGSPGFAVVLGLLALEEERARERADWRSRLQRLESEYRQADLDRTARQRQVEELQHLFAQADADRIAHQKQIETFKQLFEQADFDRTERQRQVDELQRLFERADRDRIERQHQVDTLRALFEGADRDRMERQRQLESLEQLYRQADLDRGERLRRIEELEASVRQDRLERDAERGQHETEFAALCDRFEALRAAMSDHRRSRVYRAMVRAGRWRALESSLRGALDQPPPVRAVELVPDERLWIVPHVDASGRLGAVAIDCTALLPGGENGGAKLVATELVKEMSRIAPEREFLLLTSASSHHELADLDRPNVRRRVVVPAATALSEVLEDERIAALFCPMTAPPFDDPRVPVVCLVNDLQYLSYPEFFDEPDRHGRQAAFERTLRIADHIVTPSAHARSTLQGAGVQDSRVTVIPHAFSAGRLPGTSRAYASEVLERYGLDPGSYFIYPANFWPHKNHLMLLVAFGQLRHRRPDLDLQLVLTGASRPDPRIVRESVKRMGLDGRVVMPGYVPDPELSALLSHALALVFPSLYEGFGMPVVEAFAAGCPVSCANTSSLPEVAGHAALYFDPRKPEAIVDALEQLATCPTLTADLRVRGRERAARMDSSECVARVYLDIIDRIASRPRRSRNHLAGVFGDRWTMSSLLVMHEAGGGDLHLHVENPRAEKVLLSAAGGESVALEPQSDVALRCPLPDAAGMLQITVHPTFRPSDRESSVDTRNLGVVLRACALRRRNGDAIDLLSNVGHV
jgi:glycosyltransferase involved in cell wall biosynthesis/2-polyprenyl-3-methyl-5-hydroxy-6-metoxy-1,4-benzoquinol methylase